MHTNFKALTSLILLFFALSFATVQAQQVFNTTAKDSLAAAGQYSTGGFATIVIDRPIAVAAAMVTDVQAWPKINIGVTKAIHLVGDTLKIGAVFQETIASPIPGIADWTNSWLVEEYIPGERFVISGAENFAKAPIYSRLTYTFEALSPNSTRYSRKIEVSLDASFLNEASSLETEALYRFLGSQYEMVRHLKKYVEANSL